MDWEVNVFLLPSELDDLRRLRAAEGYIELGMFDDADAELDQIDPSYPAVSRVLALRLCTYAGLAKWDGANWSAPFGSGLVALPGTATATTLALIGNDLYVGGRFAYAGDKPSMFFARWNDQKNFYPPPNPRLINPRWAVNGQFGFRLTGTSGERYVIESTSNFGTWTPLATNSMPLFDFIDLSASNAPASAYRAVLR